MAKAYLVVSIRVNGPIPSFHGVDIQSGADLAVYLGVLSMPILDVEGESFQDAHDKLVRLVMEHPSFEWARPWIETGYEAHKRRFELYRIRDAVRRFTSWFSRLAAKIIDLPDGEREYPTASLEAHARTGLRLLGLFPWVARLETGEGDSPTEPTT